MGTTGVQISLEQISKIFHSQKIKAQDARGLDYNRRIKLLKELKAMLVENRSSFYEALRSDLGKSDAESLTSEVEFLYRAIDLNISELDSWMQDEEVGGSMLSFPSKAYRIPEPYGTALIISPWNYPLQLALAPAISAIAAGNRVILKPSEYTPQTSNLLAILINKHFDSNEMACVTGGIEASQTLLALPFDKIFFTGSTKVGKIVMRAAAEHLSDVTLELGGKSPAIIDRGMNLEIVAKRVAHGKLYNTGQTCIAPDYVLVHSDDKAEFISRCRAAIESFYGTNPADSPDYGRIVHQGHWDQLNKLLVGQKKVISIGEANRDKLFFPPTLVDDPGMDSDLMQDEIFGPILPILTYNDEEDILRQVRSLPNPLSLYCFSNNKAFKQGIVRSLHFGGGTINDTLEHYVNSNLPFGGKGESGLGSYHGKWGFDCFSHFKSIVEKSARIDIPLKYPPYAKKIGLLRWAYKWL